MYRFVTESTVEERIVERAAKKLKLDSLVIQKGRLGQASHKGPSTNELHQMLQFGAQEVYRTQASTDTHTHTLASTERRTPTGLVSGSLHSPRISGSVYLYTSTCACT